MSTFIKGLMMRMIATYFRVRKGGEVKGSIEGFEGRRRGNVDKRGL